MTVDWWEAYCNAHANADTITWNEFKTNFRSHYVPAGEMMLKQQEFRDLCQGSMTVSEYLNQFTQLLRYAPDDVSSDARKQHMFMKGLHNDLQI